MFTFCIFMPIGRVVIMSIDDSSGEGQQTGQQNFAKVARLCDPVSLAFLG